MTYPTIASYKAALAEVGITTEPAETNGKTIREITLDDAKSLVVGDRDAQYGSPHTNFSLAANALNAYGYRGPDGRKMMPHDVAFFQILVKLSRIVETPTKMDSWTDISGYGACGAEVVEVERAVNG